MEKIERQIEKKSDKENVDLVVRNIQGDLRRHSDDIKNLQTSLNQKMGVEDHVEGGGAGTRHQRSRGRCGRLFDSRVDGEMIMARPQARLGDISSHGGVIITGAMRTVVNGRPAARLGDLHACPIPGHGVTPIVTGSLDTTTEGMPNARIGDVTTCGAVIVTGSLDTTDN